MSTARTSPEGTADPWAGEYVTTETLIYGDGMFTELLASIRRDTELVAAMWADAESAPDELDRPGTHWTVALLEDGTPAAWCAARIESDLQGEPEIKCIVNYERREHRDRGLYELAYHARHRDVILAYGLPCVTFLFEQPIILHKRSGWYQTGLTDRSAQGNQWWQLRRDTRQWSS